MTTTAHQEQTVALNLPPRGPNALDETRVLRFSGHAAVANRHRQPLGAEARLTIDREEAKSWMSAYNEALRGEGAVNFTPGQELLSAIDAMGLGLPVVHEARAMMGEGSDGSGPTILMRLDLRDEGDVTATRLYFMTQAASNDPDLLNHLITVAPEDVDPTFLVADARNQRDAMHPEGVMHTGAVRFYDITHPASYSPNTAHSVA
jgi:hypothetical protein